ncbi:putative leucine-rich repeat-containing protein DDB_G0290503 isoform X1 [Procambarus clarkii]
MEAGDIRVNRDSGTLHSTDLASQYNNRDSEVFDVVIDPLTDFQRVLDLNDQHISPQQSYNLTSLASSDDLCEHIHNEHTVNDLTQYKSEASLLQEKSETPFTPTSSAPPSRTLLYNIIDSHLWNSDGSLASGSGRGSGECSFSSSGAGSCSNQHRLIVAEVHRFGYRPPCIGSPHDLATCPGVASASTPLEVQKSEGRHHPGRKKPAKYALGKSFKSLDTCDALKALNQASSALALTETFIGPLRIPPVSKEVLNKVVCNMEKKVIVQLPVNTEASQDFGCVTPREAVNTQLSNYTLKRPLSTVTCAVDESHSSGRVLGSLPSVLHAGVHQSHNKTLTNVCSSTERMYNTRLVSPTAKDVRTSPSNVAQQENLYLLSEGQKVTSPPIMEVRCKSRVITVPAGMSDHGPVEVYKEVHQYPASSITTVVEKRSYMGQTQQNTKPPSGKLKHKKNRHKLKENQESNHYASKSSLGSESSACTSVASDNTIISQNSSELTPISPSKASSSKTSLNDTLNDSAAGPISRPVLSAAIMQMRQALESVSNISDNHSDRSSGGNEAASNFSDTSSNLSTLSDLSGYEDEYIKIKRLVSDAVIPSENYKKMINKISSKPSLSKPVPSIDYEKVIRDLQAQKEDLEIQLHRFSIQVQNAVREKELYQQQLELMQTKVTETNQKQYFEVLKHRANLEGQLELLKQEFENSVYEKSQLQTKLSNTLKECEVCKSLATSAKEAELQMKARLSKYEETNKQLEEITKELEGKIERISKDYEISQRKILDHEGKNEQLELSLAQLRDSETQMIGEIKSLRSYISQMQTECQSRSAAQTQAESALNKSSTELQTLQTSNVWYQEQLQMAQAARSSLQQELLEARASLARVSSEKETLETKVQTLIHEAEDGQARAVREKATLVAHLEALQADMAEREAVLSQLERDRGSDTKLMEDRRQRLEQDHHRIHKLRLDLSDAERHLDFLRDDLKHKCTLLTKYECELKDLRTSSAVNQEVLRERDTRIENLEKTLRDMKLKAKDYQEEMKNKDFLITTLKEEKLKLEISLAAANSEKKEVDDAIVKVREDMTKLSSSFYRMKHDLAAKDRQIEVLMRDAKDNSDTKLSLEKKLEALEVKVREDEEKKRLAEEVESLQFSLKEVASEKEKLEKELNFLRKTSKVLEIEKKGLNEAVHLREEQIQNMQGSLESYREAILKKDEELYVIHEQNSTMEKTYIELRRNWEILKDETLVLRHDAEAYAEFEKLQKKEKLDLKESIQKERKLKQNLEKKIDTLIKTHDEEKCKMLQEKENANTMVNELSRELKAIKDEKIKNYESQMDLERKCSELHKELKVAQEEKGRLEMKMTDIVMELDSYKSNITNKMETIKSLGITVETTSKKNVEIEEKLTSLHIEKEKEAMELHNTLQARLNEMAKLKKMHKDTEDSLAKLKQERNMLSSQVNTLLADNNHLKKTVITQESLVKESKTSGEHNNGSKKVVKSSESLQKELVSLQSRLSDCEVKLKETIKQKESLQSAMKNVKKENFLMKAKLKDLDFLKRRCKELELSVKDSKEFESFRIKLKDLESKLNTKCNELSSLNLSLKEKTSHIQTLKQREQELCAQAEVLHADKREKAQKILTLEEIHERVHKELSNCQQQLKIAENERDEWMAKYESLRDFIPERDTSTQPAVQLEPLNHQSFSNGQESILVSGTSDTAENVIANSMSNLNFFSDTSQTSVTNDIQFDRMMADLQAQVSVTSKALQNKEEQIHDLQHQLKSIKQEGLDVGTSSRVSHVCSNEMVPESLHKKQINELLERIQHLKLSSTACYNCNNQQETQATREGLTENESLINKLKDLESIIDAKEVELQEKQTKITVAAKEFSEKKRRYESNVRLLTRKLKEHMKGRKSAEKEMKAQAEDHQHLLNEEQQRYAVLRCRCMELEGQRESLEGQVAGLESEVEEVRNALGHARQEAFDHHNNTLTLQKEMGRLQEICKAADNLRLEVTNLEETIRHKDKQLKELERELKCAQEEVKEMQKNSILLSSTIQEMKDQNERILHEMDTAKNNLILVKQELKTKEEEVVRVEESAHQLQTVNTQLRLCMTEADTKCETLSAEMKQLREEKQAVIEDNQRARMHLHESLAKIAALENHIKVVEGEVKVGKEEACQLKEQLVTKDSSHKVKVTQLEQSVARARQEVVVLTSQLDQVQQERVSYQTQATELRTALHSTLRQLKAHQEEEEARAAEVSTIKSELGVIPSPSPLDLTALTQLMERSARPMRSTLPLANLESCLSSLKAEVNMLQTRLQNKTKELADGLNPDAVAMSESESVILDAA